MSGSLSHTILCIWRGRGGGEGAKWTRQAEIRMAEFMAVDGSIKAIEQPLLQAYKKKQHHWQPWILSKGGRHFRIPGAPPQGITEDKVQATAAAWNVVDRFYIALFSALGQTNCALVIHVIKFQTALEQTHWTLVMHIIKFQTALEQTPCLTLVMRIIKFQTALEQTPCLTLVMCIIKFLSCV